jgi:hypothetical protein
MPKRVMSQLRNSGGCRSEHPIARSLWTALVLQSVGASAGFCLMTAPMGLTKTGQELSGPKLCPICESEGKCCQLGLLRWCRLVVALL